MQKKSERLQKIISAYGIASRRKVEKMIVSGRVSVNGVVATLGQSAIPCRDVITIDNKVINENNNKIYIMLNKPCGYITTTCDDRSRRTIMELVEGIDTRIYPIGRLDMNSQGLILLTNDGEFANMISHPSYGKKKTYEVQIEGDAKKAAHMLKKPLNIDGYKVHALDVKIISVTEGRGVIRIAISEGRNRQIRKMCAICGVRVISLKRVSIAELKLGTLETGKWRHLTDAEVHSFYT